MRRAALALTAAFGLAIFAADPADAATCSSRVLAKGAPGYWHSSASNKARNAWVEKVRGDRNLGPAFASWRSAKAAHISCKKEGWKQSCTASARPCKA